MARIHGISGSTRVLLNGVRPVNGKKPANLEEIEHFLDNYDKILKETEEILHRQHESMILQLDEQATRLDRKIQGDIAKRTRDVYTHMLEVNNKIETSESMLWRWGYTIQFWLEDLLSSYRINGPSRNDRIDLNHLQHQKTRAVESKTAVVKAGCRTLSDNKQFLKEKEPFLIGARGEEEVIRQLSFLPDTYHVLNDVNLHFDRAIYWKKYRQYVKNCQIDHVVVGPTGLFLLETKNWRRKNLEIGSENVIFQVQRANLALWYYLKDYYWRNEHPKISSVIVSMYGFSKNQKSDPYINAMTPDRLCSFIAGRDSQFSESDIHKLIKLIPCREVY